jgi:hypothetical protein
MPPALGESWRLVNGGLCVKGSDLAAAPEVVTSSRSALRNQIFQWLRRLLEEVSIEFRDSLRFGYERLICVLCVVTLKFHQLGGLLDASQLRNELRIMLH